MKFFSSLYGFIRTNGEISKNPDVMCEIAADYYEDFFKEPENIHHPQMHPRSNGKITMKKSLQLRSMK
jgi:hypothetical protein